MCGEREREREKREREREREREVINACPVHSVGSIAL